MNKLTHFDDTGAAHMVDVGSKALTERLAIAEGYIELSHEALDMVVLGTHKKGDVLGVARIAGIMASKQTSQLIPLCHSVSLSHVSIQFEPQTQQNSIHCVAKAKTVGQTGVEMEALLAVQMALITIYDMCKSIDKGMIISGVRLIEKSGGKSGVWSRISS